MRRLTFWKVRLSMEILAATLRRTHRVSGRVDRCERGLEAMQVVMVIAIATVCLIAVRNQWPAIRDWFSELLTIVIEV